MVVRNEAVRLSLQDAGFSTGMAKAAAAATLLDRALDDLDGSTTDLGRTEKQTARDTDTLGDSFQRNQRHLKDYTLEMAVADERSSRLRNSLREQAKAAIDAEQGIDRTTEALRRSGPELNFHQRRIRRLTHAAALLGPSLVPIGAIAIPAVTGLATQLTAAGTGAASLVVAFQGVGEALEAVNAAALEPTAENLEAAREAMAGIAPEAQAFVTRFQELRPVLGDIRDAAAAGWFPGLTDALDDLERLAPKVAELFAAFGSVGGGLVDEAAGSQQLRDFLDYIGREGPQTFEALARAVGNFTDGLFSMLEAFTPLNRDFNAWLLDVSRSFAGWADGLAQTDGFRDFVDYIRENGPRVAEAMGALGSALVHVVEALAPLGGPSLKIIETFADAIATIADSDLGTPILTGMAALAAYNRVLAITVGLQARLNTLGGGAIAGAGGRSRGGGAVVGTAKVAGVLVAATAALEASEGFQQERAPDRKPGSIFDLGGLAKYGLFGEFFREKGFETKDLLGIGANNRFGVGDLGRVTAQQRLDADVRSAFSDPSDTFQRDVESEVKGIDRDFIDPEYAKRVKEAAAAQLGLSEAFLTSQRAAGKSTEEIVANEAALRANREVALGAFSAQTRMAQAFADVDKNLKRNNAGLNLNTEQGRENRFAVESLIGSWNQYQSTGEATRKEFKAQRSAFIELADQMGIGEKRARELWQEMAKVPEKVETDVRANTAPALDAIAGVDNRLRQLDGKTATVTTIHRTTLVGVDNRLRQLEQADGGTIPGQRQPYGDKVPAMLAPGEEVISNRFGQADRNRALLKAINDNRLADGGTVGMANGGTVSMSRILRLADQGKLGKLDALNIGFGKLEKALAKSEKALDKERQQRDNVRSQMRSLSGSVRGRLQSDLFGGQTDGFGSDFAAGSFGDVIGTLQGDIREGRQFRRATRTLRGKGLDGSALEALLAEGDPAAFANLSRQQLQQYERLFERRQRVTASAGQVAGEAAFGKALDAQTRELKEAKQELRAIKKTIREEHREDRQSSKRGAGRAARGRR